MDSGGYPTHHSGCASYSPYTYYHCRHYPNAKITTKVYRRIIIETTISIITAIAIAIVITIILTITSITLLIIVTALSALSMLIDDDYKN